MAKCDYCGTTIVFGGARDGNLRFCNDRCRQNGALIRASQQLPNEVVQQHLWAVFQGLCPKCGGNGPVDVHTSYRVWSALYLTSWNSRPEVCCRSCGTKKQLGDTAFCLFLGWWGFPWGIVMTPVQLCRNISGVFGGALTNPSPQLERFVRMHLAAQAAAPPPGAGPSA